MNGSCVIAKIAGTESIAKITSTASISTNARNRGVAHQTIRPDDDEHRAEDDGDGAVAPAVAADERRPHAEHPRADDGFPELVRLGADAPAAFPEHGDGVAQPGVTDEAGTDESDENAEEDGQVLEAHGRRACKKRSGRYALGCAFR